MRGSRNRISGFGQHVTEQAATLGQEVRGGKPEAFVPTDSLIVSIIFPQVLSFTSTTPPFSVSPPQVKYRSLDSLESISSSATPSRPVSLSLLTAAFEDL